MRAVFLASPKKIEIRDIPVPAPAGRGMVMLSAAANSTTLSYDTYRAINIYFSNPIPTRT